MHRSAPVGNRVLITAPYGSDAASVAALLGEQNYEAKVFATIVALANAIDDQAGVIVVTEEALRADLAPLHRALAAQPDWSDIPFILLAGRSTGRAVSGEWVRRQLPDNALNVILLERPLSGESLTSTVAAAMRSRQKQFEIRDRIAELGEGEARLSTLLAALPVGVAFINRDGTTLLSNPAFRRFLPSGDIPSRLPDGEARWEGYDADGRRITRERFATVRALQGERVQGMEFRHHPESGAPVWTRVSGIPLKNGDEVTGAISVIVDIDDEKRGQTILAEAAQKLEQQVAERTSELTAALARLEAEAKERARAEEALRQSQKMEAVGQLTGGIAHDFNNLLTGIMGALDVVRRRIANGRTDDLDRFMDAATVSAERAAALTARLLAFSRRQSLDSRPTDVNRLLASLEDLLHRTMSERIEVSIEFAGSLPLALVDANQLENAILNLAINARDAMPQGGRLALRTHHAQIDAEFCAEHDGFVAGSYVAVTVSDSGAGMDAATLAKAFDPFFTTKPIGQGTGLGLSMVYGFAKQSHGHVAIDTEVGVGTDVTVYLPIADEPAERPEITKGPVLDGDGQTVLLVEDDAAVRLLVADVLGELGYRAQEAADPQSAIALIESGSCFDLMITDVGLPGMNGRQLAEIARKHLPDLPILFITGYAQNAEARGGFLGPNMEMISKPFPIEILAGKIREMLA